MAKVMGYVCNIAAHICQIIPQFVIRKHKRIWELKRGCVVININGTAYFFIAQITY